MELFTKVRKTLRSNVWWNSKIPLLLAMAYGVLLNENYHPSIGAILLVLIFVWLVGAAGFGNYLNDLADVKEDKIAGKENGAANHSAFQSGALLLSLGTLALSPWLFPSPKWVPLLLAAAHLLMFILYSVRPIRLKERGFPGLLADALYAHVLPSWLAISVMVPSEDWYHFRSHQVFLGLVGVWAFSLGIRGILTHQISDFQNDLKSKTTTFVTKIGIKKSVSMLRGLFLPLEFLSFIGMWIFLDEGYWWMSMALMGFMPWKFILMKAVWKMDMSRDYQLPLFNSYFSNFYEQWMAVIILFFLAIANPWYWILMILHLFLFQETVRNFWNEISSLFRYLFRR